MDDRESINNTIKKEETDVKQIGCGKREGSTCNPVRHRLAPF